MNSRLRQCEKALFVALMAAVFLPIRRFITGFQFTACGLEIFAIPGQKR
jgi:hypothetical protein